MLCARDLVDLINENDAVLLRLFYGLADHIVHVDQLFGFLLYQDAPCFAHFDAAVLLLFRNEPAHHFIQVDVNSKGKHGVASRAVLFDFDLNKFFFQLPCTELCGDFLPPCAVLCLFFLRLGRFAAWLPSAEQELKRVHGRRRTLLCTRHKQVDQPLVRRGFRNDAHSRHAFILAEADRCFNKVADHGVHIPPHIADFRKLRGLHLHKRRIHKLCKPPCDLGFADARGAHHDDVLRRDLLPELGRKAAPAVTVAQRDRHGAFRLILADDITIKRFNDFTRCKHLYFLHGDVAVGEYADVRSDAERLLRDLRRRKLRILPERLCSRKRVHAAGADGSNAVIRVDHLTRAGNDQKFFRIRGNEHGLKLPHGLVAAPILRKRYGGPAKAAAVLFQLRLKALREGERIRHGARKAHDHAVVVQPPHLFRMRLHHGLFAKRHLTIARHSTFSVPADGHDRRSHQTHNSFPFPLHHLRRNWLFICIYNSTICAAYGVFATCFTVYLQSFTILPIHSSERSAMRV